MASLEGGPASVGSGIRASFKHVLADGLKYPEVRVGTTAIRTEVQIPAQQTSYVSNSNQIMKFQLSNSNFFDFRRGYLRFTLSVSVVGGTYVRIHNGIWSVFERQRIIGTSEIEDVRKTNMLHNMIFESGVEPPVQSNLYHAISGVGSQAQREAWAAAPKEYALPLLLGTFTNSILPLNLINESLYVEIYIANPTEFVETDGTNPVITITDPRIHCDRVLTDPSYTAAVKNQISAAGMNMAVCSYEHFANNVNSANNMIQINHRSDSIDSIIHIMRNANDVNNLLIDDRLRTFNYNNCQTFRLKFNSILYPEEPIRATGSAVHAYLELTKWYGKWNIQGTMEDTLPIDGVDFLTDRFFIINDLTVHPGENLVNPRGTSRAGSDMQLDLILAGVPVTPQQLESFVKYTVFLNVNKNGRFQRAI